MYGSQHPTTIHPLKKITYHPWPHLANHQSNSTITQIYISSKISLKQHPEIILLKREDEPADIMQKLGYEDILLTWINYHIKKNGGNR